MKTLVLGASTNPERYSYKAVKKLRNYNHEVVALGLKSGIIDDVEILTGLPVFEDIHTVTMYLGYRNQKEYYDYVLSLRPKRIIFNPGTENPELERLAHENSIEIVQSCTLVMLSTNEF